HRQQHAAFQILAERIPIDVEIARIGRRLTPFENIEPPRIVGTPDRHMVWHDVENEAHAMRLQRCDKRAEFRFAPDLRVKPVVIDDVVAMRRAGPRLHQWRRVDVTDPEPGQIGHERGSVAKREALMELQPVGGADDWRSGLAVAHSDVVLDAACRRAATSRSASRVMAAPATISSIRDASRLCQFGWLSLVPGKLACSLSPMTSSSCTSISRDCDRAR